MNLKVTDKEFDIIVEALTVYNQICSENSYVYTTEEVEELMEKLNIPA